MNKIGRYIEYFLSIPKSLYFCCKYFPLSLAYKLPIFISWRTQLYKMKGKIIVDRSKIKTGGIKIGFGYVGIFDRKNSKSIWECDGKVIINGKNIFIGHGSKISVGKEGILEIGNNFDITAETQIICNKHISIKNDVLISWQCLIMDTDFHNIYINNKKENEDKEIIIHDHVWIGCRSTILKGIEIYKNNIVASNSNVVKTIRQENVILGGNPANIIKRNIEWSK